MAHIQPAKLSTASSIPIIPSPSKNPNTIDKCFKSAI
jgi:hypothetical protein